jgi:hypothetical protein
MSLVFKNALMPSEDQQALRLRLAYLMRRYLLAPLIFTLLSPVQVEAHPISLEERAVDLVIAKYDKQLKKRLEGTGVNPAYMVFKEDDCNVRVKAGTHQEKHFSVMEWFEVDVCQRKVELKNLIRRDFIRQDGNSFY